VQRHTPRNQVTIRRALARPTVLALAAILCTLPAAAFAQSTLVDPPNSAITSSELAPAPAAPRAQSSDLRPRPLGTARGGTSVLRPDSAPSAASPSTSSSSTTLIQTLASLGMVLGLILALGAGIKRLMRSRGGFGTALSAMGAAPSPAGILEVIGRYPLSRGTSLVLLKVDRRVLLLAQGTPGLRVRGGAPLPITLCEISDPDDVASIMIKANEAEGRSIGTTFRQALAGFERQHDGVIEEPRPSLFGRIIRRGTGGDRTELLDESSLDSEQDPLHLRDFERHTADPVGSLRSRLTALRGGGVQ